MQRVHELPYSEDSTGLFEKIADRPWSVFLDSGRPMIGRGRFDILTSDPMITVTARGMLTEIRSGSGLRRSSADPFELLRETLDDVRPAGKSSLPFNGGAIGWFGYDLSRRIERLPSMAEVADDLPDLAVGIFDWAVVVDHEKQSAWLTARGRDPRTHLNWDRLVEMFSIPSRKPYRSPFHTRGEIRSNMTYRDYADRFHRIQEYIRNGDCYQVNLAQSFEVSAEGDPWEGYRELRLSNPAPFSAYLNTPYATLLCSSPEEFLSLIDNEVETSPIKGTRPRGPTPAADIEQLESLRNSAKDRAENLMIVDLLRNDLGKVCAPGSVQVSDLFRLETFSGVHHMVSTIRGRLAKGNDALSLLRSCFPGGSVTGAPKLRAMEIIEELEPQRRSAYCGALGYIGFEGNMDTNIVIRTFVYSKGRLRFSAGGGIVADSRLEAEFSETLDKASAIFQLARLR